MLCSLLIEYFHIFFFFFGTYACNLPSKHAKALVFAVNCTLQSSKQRIIALDLSLLVVAAILKIIVVLLYSTYEH